MATCWNPTANNYLGRVTKTRILDAVREARGDAAAQLLDHLKKPEMAKEAERLLVDTGWLPEPLRIPVQAVTGGSESLPAFLAGDETAATSPDVIAAE
jgi:ParB family chromosome partitioning protein